MWATQSTNFNQCPGLIISLSTTGHSRKERCSLYSASCGLHWLIELSFYVALDKQVISDMFLEPISWLGMEKLNLTQQKHTFTHQQKCTTTQNTHKKLKPGLVASYDMRPGNGEGLFWFQHFINLSVTTYPLTYSPRYMGRAHHVCNHSTCFNKETQFF